MKIKRILVLLLIISMAGTSACTTTRGAGTSAPNTTGSSTSATNQGSDAGQQAQEESAIPESQRAKLASEEETAGRNVMMILVYVIAFAVGWQIGTGL